MNVVAMSHQSFYAQPPPEGAADALTAYLAFLERRNGSLDADNPFPRREQWLAAINDQPVRYEGAVDEGLFQQSYERFDPRAAASPALVSLLAFVKMNAGEAYGVEAVAKARHGQPVGDDLMDRVERVLGREETYHTRILLGSTRLFGMPEPTGAWKPPLAVKAVIGALVHAPKPLFHPVLLGAEVAGIFTFNWMLNRTRELFADTPKVRELLEERLIEVIIDEIGHVAFNRVAVGRFGMAAARQIAPHVANEAAGNTPELKALGWTKQTLADFDAFGLHSLPEEARRRAFFV